jgi:hypothetical protein
MARADPREYVLIDVDLPTHDKLAELEDPPDAGWLYVTGVCTSGKGLADGVISPRSAVRKAGVTPEVAKWLVAAGLWHEPGHDCGRCVQPPEGRVVIHDYLRHNRSKAEAEAAKESGRRAANARWSSRAADQNGTHADRIADASDPETGEQSAPQCGPHTEAEAEVEVPKPLLTFVGRLAKSDAREDARPPAEVIASWQRIAGPDVDLETEAAAYLSRNGMRPANDEAAAWVGWLKTAHRHAAKTAGIRPIGCHSCLTGWLPDEYGYASQTPCPACKPHAPSRLTPGRNRPR